MQPPAGIRRRAATDTEGVPEAALQLLVDPLLKGVHPCLADDQHLSLGCGFQLQLYFVFFVGDKGADEIKVDDVGAVDPEKQVGVQLRFEAQQAFVVDVFLVGRINDVNHLVVRVAVNDVFGVEQEMFDSVFQDHFPGVKFRAG